MKKLLLGTILLTAISQLALAQTELDVEQNCKINHIQGQPDFQTRLNSHKSLKTRLPRLNPASATPPIANMLYIGNGVSIPDLGRSLSVSQGENNNTAASGNSTAVSIPNQVTNILNSGNGTVTNSPQLSGGGNQLANTVTANGAIDLAQSIVGNSNVIQNFVGAQTPVASFAHTLSIAGGSTNIITNTADGAGIKTIVQTLTNSSNNMIATNLSSSDQQTANLTITNSNFVDYVITSTASSSYANVSLSNMTGTASSADIIRVVQTDNASGASTTLTVDSGHFKIGTLTGTLPGSTAGTAAGVVVYQNSPNASLSASLTGASGYTAIFKQ